MMTKMPRIALVLLFFARSCALDDGTPFARLASAHGVTTRLALRQPAGGGPRGLVLDDGPAVGVGEPLLAAPLELCLIEKRDPPPRRRRFHGEARLALRLLGRARRPRSRRRRRPLAGVRARCSRAPARSRTRSCCRTRCSTAWATRPPPTRRASSARRSDHSLPAPTPTTTTTRAGSGRGHSCARARSRCAAAAAARLTVSRSCRSLTWQTTATAPGSASTPRAPHAPRGRAAEHRFPRRARPSAAVGPRAAPLAPGDEVLLRYGDELSARHVFARYGFARAATMAHEVFAPLSPLAPDSETSFARAHGALFLNLSLRSSRSLAPGLRARASTRPSPRRGRRARRRRRC